MLRTCIHLSVVGLLSLTGLPAARAQSADEVLPNDTVAVVGSAVAGNRLTGGSISDRPTAEISLRPPATSVGGAPKAAGENSTSMAPRDVHFGSDVPSLRVNTQGPDTLVVGKAAEYLITLGNQSEFSAAHIVVRIQIPSWVELQQHRATLGAVERQAADESGSGQLVWKVDQIAGHGEQVLALMLIPRAGRAFELGVDVSVRPTTSATKIAVKEPKVDLQLSGTEDVVSGEAAQWTVLLENPGTGAAHQMTLDLYAGTHKLGTQAIGTLEAGGQRVVDVRLMTREPGQHQLRAVATAEPGLTAETSTAYLVRRGELQVQVSGPGFEYAGTQATYQVHVRNSGDAPAKGVRMEFILPQGAKYIGRLGETGAGSAAAPAGLHWTVAEIQPGREESFRIACELSQPGDHRAVVRAGNAEGLAAAAEVNTHVEAAADLQLQVIDPAGPRAVGSPVEIEIRLINRGTDAARQVFVSAMCGEHVELLDVTGNASIEGGEILFQPIAELAAGETFSQRVTIRSTQAGGHRFRASVECSEPESQLVCEEHTQFFVREDASRTANSAAPRTAAPLPIRKIQIR